jgi:hypothetical protein
MSAYQPAAHSAPTAPQTGAAPAGQCTALEGELAAARGEGAAAAAERDALRGGLDEAEARAADLERARAELGCARPLRWATALAGTRRAVNSCGGRAGSSAADRVWSARAHMW